MLQTNLKKHPERLLETLNLIEKSFNYSPSNKFTEDFYPLMNNSNHENCHILIHENKVIAHIGALEQKLDINSTSYNITMFGGISVDEEMRGRSIFKSFFKEVLLIYKNSPLHLLWSDQVDLYRKFNFIPSIGLCEYSEHKDQISSLLDIKQTKYKELSDVQKKEVQSLYQMNNEIRIKRDENSWQKIENITSANLFLIYKEKKIVNYFFRDKGEDLENIIHEYGYIDKETLVELKKFGKVWTPYQEQGLEFTLIYAALLKPNNIDAFKKLIKDYAEIEIRNISIADDLISFSFQQESYELSQADFLTGVFGPNSFKELRIRSLYISGLDSI